MTLKNPFFKIIADTMTAEAERHGFDVVVTDAERDVNRQSQQVDNFLASGVAAIVLNPVDRIAIGPAVRRANEAGVPVFTSDLQAVAEGVEIAGHVRHGQLPGRAACRRGDDRGARRGRRRGARAALQAGQLLRPARRRFPPRDRGVQPRSDRGAGSRSSPSSKAAACATRVTGRWRMASRPTRTSPGCSRSTTPRRWARAPRSSRPDAADQVRIVGLRR